TFTIVVTLTNECGSVTFTKTETITVGISEVKALSNSIKAYPNPTSDVVILKSSHSTMKGIVVYNNLGSVVLEQNSLSSREVSLNLNGLAAGLYQVVINTEDGLAIKMIEVKK